MFDLYHYSLISVPRTTNKRGGGVALYINKSIQYKIIKNNVNLIPTCELCAIELCPGNMQSIFIIVTYKPHDHDISLFSDQLLNFVDSLNLKKHLLYIVRDFNIDLLRYQSHTQTTQFLDNMISNGL
jgi:hypothetical protein